MLKHLALALAVFGAPLAAQLNTVQTVYLFPMASGLDQYLAHRLTAEGVFQVVTDPLKADAVVTDRLGEAFEARFTELYIAPEEKKRAEEAKKAAEEAAKDKKDKQDKESAAQTGTGDVSDQAPVRASSFARGRGTLFLVERKSRAVVWSAYAPPKDSSSRELDRAAGRIVGSLKKSLGKK
ncbi:MAG: hypothetical protein HY822_23835 [Acidobacteria bacterium]|nr:hypothetical protein [Acidobacteriota bacterium]